MDRAALWIIALAFAILLLRIGLVHHPDHDTPFLSANDTSRWCTVRAVADYETYAIDEFEREPAWRTIDKVQHRDREGELRLYSSKPVLFPTAVASSYSILQRVTGLRIDQHPFAIGRVLLAVHMAVPLLIYFLFFARMLHRMGLSAFGQGVLLVTAAFGTFVTTFAVSLNNHTLGAVCALLLVDALWPIRVMGRQELWRFLGAGLWAGLLVSFELPALAWVAMVTVWLLVQYPKRTLLGFVPALAAIGALYLGSNHLAHDSWRPPYLHNGPGQRLVSVEWTDPAPPSGRVPSKLARAMEDTGVPLARSAKIFADGNGWEIDDREMGNRYVVVARGQTLDVHAWDNWYDYPGSFWTEVEKSGITAGERSGLAYAFHVLVGHHGLLSLTPMFALSLWGGFLLLRRKGPTNGGDAGEAPRESAMRALAVSVGLATLVVMWFYLTRPAGVRNYGGTTAAFRWMIWMAPLWLLLAAPAVERLGRSTRGRTITWVLMVVSIASASYAWLNPWVRPWLYELWA